MSEKIRIAVDAMGGDNAPGEIVKGAVQALEQNSDITVILVGRRQALDGELAKYTCDKSRLETVYAEEVIETAEPPVKAIRRKKDSSLVVCMRLVHDGQADAMVSAGSSGAILAGGQFIVGRIKGIERAPFAPMLPTEKGGTLLVDCGANVDARPGHLVQWAQMGTIYMRDIAGIRQPSVGILNIGAEDDKGNKLVKETFPLLQACEDIHFIGSVEARDVPYGAADIVVCDAFAGNILLKMYEGVASLLMKKLKESIMSSVRSKIGGALIKPALKNTLKTFDVSAYGGAPMLGLRGLVVKSHGNATAKEISVAIGQCVEFQAQRIGEQIEEKIARKNRRDSDGV
jgi:glycerol-3-phosphate acyltransferase PlsX